MSTLAWSLVASLLTALAFGLFILLTRARGTPYLELNSDAYPPIADGLPFLAGVSESVVHRGNRAAVFKNGDIFQSMLEDIAAAKHSVHLETFVWSEGTVERQFVDAFVAKAREGKKVRVLIDCLGGSEAGEAQLDRLRNGGVHLAIYCEPHWWNVGRFNHRTHRKLLIIDGRIGYTFGHGIADQWLGEGTDPEHWRDTGVRVEGPVVHAMQTVFSENWIEETKTLPACEECFPELEPVGDVAAHVVSSASGDAVSSVAVLYTVAIAMARREVLIQNPYFAPNDGVVELLVKMVARGVKVSLMVPGEHTDSPFVRRAGMHLYDAMLAGGVEIFEFAPTLLHQKVVVVDEIWSHVGSTNFDARSLALNEEVGIGVCDADVARELKSAFAADLRQCEKLDLETWRRRPLWNRAYERFAYLLHEQL